MILFDLALRILWQQFESLTVKLLKTKSSRFEGLSRELFNYGRASTYSDEYSEIA